MAASLVIISLPGAADARGGGGHGGMAGHMGMATSQTLTSRAMMPLATAPGGKQAAPQSPSQSQTAAAAAAAVAAAGPQSMTIPTTPLPPSAIRTPAPQESAIAPLSPSPAQIIDSSGGSATTTSSSTAISSTTSGVSPSQSAPSAPGGGGDTVQACMGFWDAGTHMSKVEWRAACARTQNRLDLHTPVP